MAVRKSASNKSGTKRPLVFTKERLRDLSPSTVAKGGYHGPVSGTSRYGNYLIYQRALYIV